MTLLQAEALTVEGARIGRSGAEISQRGKRSKLGGRPWGSAGSEPARPEPSRLESPVGHRPAARRPAGRLSVRRDRACR